MERTKAWVKLISILFAIVMVWCLLFGVHLIGYFEAISERGLRTTECGAKGCGNLELLLNVAWTTSFYIIIPLIIPLSLVIYFCLKKGKRTR